MPCRSSGQLKPYLYIDQYIPATRNTKRNYLELPETIFTVNKWFSLSVKITKPANTDGKRKRRRRRSTEDAQAEILINCKPVLTEKLESPVFSGDLNGRAVLGMEIEINDFNKNDITYDIRNNRFFPVSVFFFYLLRT